MPDDLDVLANRLSELATTLPTKIIGDVLLEIGVAAKGDITEAVSFDIGGNTFSGWKRAPIVSGFELTSSTSLEIAPRKRSQGPMKVAQSGRRPGTKYSRKARRQVSWGRTSGKATWDDSVRAITRETPRRALALIGKAVREAIR